jgi:hypothetical protein
MEENLCSASVLLVKEYRNTDTTVYYSIGCPIDTFSIASVLLQNRISIEGGHFEPSTSFLQITTNMMIFFRTIINVL